MTRTTLRNLAPTTLSKNEMKATTGGRMKLPICRFVPWLPSCGRLSGPFRVLRLTNVRANATGLPGGASV